MDLFVGNLPLELDDERLKNLLEPYSKAASAKMVKEKGGVDFRGFGFVTVPGKESTKVIAQLKGQVAQTHFLGTNLRRGNSYLTQPKEKKWQPA